MSDEDGAISAGSPEQMTQDDFEDAASDLIAAADYLKTALDAGQGVYESKWLGAVMRAHEMLLAAADFQKTPAAS